MKKDIKVKSSNENSTIKKNIVNYKNEIINVSVTTIVTRKKIAPTKITFQPS